MTDVYNLFSSSWGFDVGWIVAYLNKIQSVEKEGLNLGTMVQGNMEGPELKGIVEINYK